ncbi:MAG: hypothetical protein KAS04_01285 [Candidatus Aenigmarchaeota archaeon]|nr:hypothetical protein [Candidatus Aenigmarchaeota archaeon]
MKTKYKICIILTFLIAIFFLGKWVNEVRPKYEWQESIYVANNVVDYWSLYNDDFCEEIEYINSEIKYVDADANCDNAILVLNNPLESSKKCLFENKVTIKVCYKKEKVRIN